MAHVEEEDLILGTQNAEQAAECQGAFIDREADVVRLVTNGASAQPLDRERHNPKHFAVCRSVFIKVDDGDEVRSLVCLVPRPDKQRLLCIISVSACDVRPKARAQAGHKYPECELPQVHACTCRYSSQHVTPLLIVLIGLHLKLMIVIALL